MGSTSCVIRQDQTREFHNYMAPILLDGAWFFSFAGTRDSPNEGFRYLRIPADEESSLKEWMRLRAFLADADLRSKLLIVMRVVLLPSGDARKFPKLTCGIRFKRLS